MTEQMESDRSRSAIVPQRPNWATPVVEEFDIADTVKGALGTESDIGNLMPAAS